MTIKYRGFSTVGRTKRFKLVDLDLIKADLLNHFQIRKGEKLMNANFGTIIWNVIYDTMTQEVVQAITDDVTAIVNYDPRVQAKDIVLTEFENGLQLEIDLVEVQTNQSATMLFKFDGTTGTVTTG